MTFDEATDSASALTLSATGSLFGTTFIGGPGTDGIVYQLAPPAEGSQRLTERRVVLSGPFSETLRLKKAIRVL